LKRRVGVSPQNWVKFEVTAGKTGSESWKWHFWP